MPFEGVMAPFKVVTGQNLVLWFYGILTGGAVSLEDYPIAAILSGS